MVVSDYGLGGCGICSAYAEDGVTCDQWDTSSCGDTTIVPYGPTPINVNYDGSVSGGGSSVWTSIANIFKTTTQPGSILATRYSVPQLNAGQYIATGPNGTSVMYQQPAGGGSFGFPSLGGTGGSSTMLLLGVGAVVLFMVMGKK